MPDESEQDFDELAADLALDAKESYEENRAEQEALLSDVAEEEGAQVLETTATIEGRNGTHTVDISAKLNGDLMDAMGRIDARLERLESEEGRAYEFSETADEVAQLLEDVTDDTALHKGAFYDSYEEHGLDPLGAILEEVFESLKRERERQTGAAEGFRST